MREEMVLGWDDGQGQGSRGGKGSFKDIDLSLG